MDPFDCRHPSSKSGNRAQLRLFSSICQHLRSPLHRTQYPANRILLQTCRTKDSEDRQADQKRDDKAPLPSSVPRYMLEHRMDKSFEKTKKSAQASFVVTPACNGCEFCYRICPAGNIEMVYGRPIFLSNCTGCLACYHRCPQEAITFNRRVSSGHYPNHEAHFQKEYRE